jgi:hypothetical protein
MAVTGDGQLEFNGYILGDNETTFMEELTGWDDLPPIDSTNTARVMYHGSNFGKKYARERIVTWTGVFNPANKDDWADKISALRAAFSVNLGESDQLITIRMHDETFIAYGSVINRAIPGSRSYGAAYKADVSIQFSCSDPRRYTVDENTSSIAFPESLADGLDYPLVYPLDYGTASVSGYGDISNTGDAPNPVKFTITGPLSNPVIYNDTTSKFIEFAITLAGGETLAVDTSDSSVILNGTADRLYTKTAASSPIFLMELAPGVNSIRISAASWSLGAGVSVTARSGAFF